MCGCFPYSGSRSKSVSCSFPKNNLRLKEQLSSVLIFFEASPEIARKGAVVVVIGTNHSAAASRCAQGLDQDIFTCRLSRFLRRVVVIPLDRIARRGFTSHLYT